MLRNNLAASEKLFSRIEISAAALYAGIEAKKGMVIVMVMVMVMSCWAPTCPYN